MLDLFVETLNLNAMSPKIPEEFKNYYNEEKYKKSQEYTKAQTKLSLWENHFFLPLTITFILLGGFQYLDTIARSFGSNNIITGLIFLGILGMGSQILHIPFQIYRTFVLEEKFGFNLSNWKIFTSDLIKGIFLSALIGGFILALILWFFEWSGPKAWLYVWVAITLIQCIFMFLAPVLIMPLFNTFKALSDGELKTAIEDFAKKENFQIQGIFTMDGSRRSSKANAFFTGFGPFRRIVLFDTLIENHTTEELVAVLAHEIGHYKKKHLPKTLAVSFLSTGLILYFFSLMINNKNLFTAFQVKEVSIYASLVFMGILFSPISSLLSIFSNFMSRKHEYEADAYAAHAYKRPDQLISALKKLSVDSLSNLHPHRLKVFLEYSHPTVLNRIQALQKVEKHS